MWTKFPWQALPCNYHTICTPIVILYNLYSCITNPSLLLYPYTHCMCHSLMCFILCSPENFLQSVSSALQSGEVFIDLFIVMSALLNLWTTSDNFSLEKETFSGNLIFFWLLYLLLPHWLLFISCQHPSVISWLLSILQTHGKNHLCLPH